MILNIFWKHGSEANTTVNIEISIIKRKEDDFGVTMHKPIHELYWNQTKRNKKILQSLLKYTRSDEVHFIDFAIDSD